MRLLRWLIKVTLADLRYRRDVRDRLEATRRIGQAQFANKVRENFADESEWEPDGWLDHLRTSGGIKAA
jgi:hypothetical protein